MKKLIAILLVMTMCLSLLAACAPAEEGKSDLAKAKEYLYSLYVNKSTETATDIEYPAKVKGGDTFFAVDWTVEILSGAGEVKVVASENAGFVVVDVPEEPLEDIKYKLTATIKGEDNKSETLVYEYTVPKFKVTSYAEYAAAENGALIIAQGVVTGILSKANGDSANGLYFQDNDGGFYAYNLATDPVEDGIEVGMTVRVTGEKDLYNGTYEIINCSAKIISAEKTSVAAADWTEAFVNAADTKAAALIAQQSFLVTLKGVTIGDYAASNGYLHFDLGGKTSYLRISSSNCPILKAEETTVIETFQTKKGNLANVTGLVSLYNGAFYLTPVSVDCFEYLGLPELSDAEAVEFEKGGLSIEENYDANTELELPTVGAVYDKVAISWAVEGEGAAIVDGKLVITVPADGSDAVATLTATLTAGDSTDTVSFTLNMSLPKNLTVLEAIEKGTAMEHNQYTTIKYFVTGIITEVYNTQYGNMKIQDAQGNILTIYGTYSADGTIRYDALEVKPVAGDLVTVYGIIGQYNGTPQVKNGWIVEHDTTLSVKETIDMASSREHNDYTTEKYVVTGVITEVYNTQYGNMKITDEDGNILTIYGTYSADGTVRYDALEVKPVAGDTVTVYGIVGHYNGTPQVKNGWIVGHTPAGGESGGEEPENPENPEEPEVPADPAADSKLTIAEVLALGAAKDHNVYTEGKYYVTGVITEVYNTQYGNMKITDEAGNILTIYGTYSADGTVRYDALETKPVAGETVTIYGVVGKYNDTVQVKNGWIVAHIPAADSVLTVEEVLAVAASMDHNVYTTGKYYVTGVITEVYNTQYGNMKITDEAGNILTIYGTYSADGTVRYDALETKPVAGDTVTIYGIIGQYNGTPQVKNGWITAHTPAV